MKELFATLSYGINMIAKLSLILLIAVLVLFGFSHFAQWSTASFSNLIILESLLGIIVLTFLIYIVKIIRNPNLSSKQKLDKLFGR
ncbi:MAG: hypothetical protein SOW21_09240 [[Actinobacillus] rossii]|uniref:Uncharacterized protein n=1 Tax=[Actinobacillus] rossii TaxID=123820 RepID=A0A380TYU5_9PAST|nr:hypothetical protein [[Actinobacillus] rossii]MDD7426090.1 hypothetical protein [[Actinobacillus] rossii]MDY3124534.1 hypothetical protein [[Actinobacillus] rossii]MDY4505486.1 hypothetical protein [[Actinobacillus] rossii]SUT93626.1 Uncharacterised protein [[Actinobacillus] rossii]